MPPPKMQVVITCYYLIFQCVFLSRQLVSDGHLFFVSRRPGAARRREGHECSIAGLCAMPETDYEFMSASMEIWCLAATMEMALMGRLKHMQHVGTGSYTY